MLCDISLIILVVIPLMRTFSSKKTLLVLRESLIDRKIRRLTTKTLIPIAVLIPPYLCAIEQDKILATLNEEGKERLQFIFGITINIAHVNSFINAILFLATNVKAKQYLRSFLKGPFLRNHSKLT